MAKYLFKSQDGWESEGRFECEFEAESLLTVVENFECFLRGCGFHVDGKYLDWVEGTEEDLGE